MIAKVRVTIQEEGLHWFQVSLGGRPKTKIPLRVVYQGSTECSRRSALSYGAIKRDWGSGVHRKSRFCKRPPAKPAYCEAPVRSNGRLGTSARRSSISPARSIATRFPVRSIPQATGTNQS